MNRWIGIALLAGSCLLAGCEQLFGEDEAAPVPAPTPPTVYALTVTRGAVHLERDGVRLLADLGMIDGDVLVTGPDGAAEVRLPDGRVLEVGPNARLKVDAAEAQLRIELGRGVILARGPAGGGKPDERLVVEVKTPLGLTRLGADAEVELDADSGTIEVRLGSVVFLDGEGSTLEAEAGEQIVADASGAATVRAAVSEEEMLMLTRMEVVLAPDQPGAEILRSGETRWTAAPKEGLTLAEGDAVRAVREGARFSIGALQLELEEGGELALTAGTPREDGEPGLPSLDLMKGGLTVQASGEGPGRVLLGEMVLTTAEAGRARIVRSPAGLAVEVITGTFGIGEGAQRQLLTGGSRVDVGPGGALTIGTRTMPALALKSARSQRVHHQGLPTLALAWEHEGPVTVEVSADEEFSKLLLQGTVTAGFVEVEPPQRGALHWRVKDPMGAEVAVGSARFSPERRQRSRQVRNEVPEGAQRTTVYFQSQLPALTFVYEPHAQAESYQFRLFREGDPTTPLVERTVKTTRLELEAGTVKEGSYLWSVSPRDKAGAPLRGGRMSRLDLAYDNAVPELMVESPRPGTKVRAGELVRVSGVAPVGGRVRANGEALSLDGKGRFNGRVRADTETACIIFELSRAGVPDSLTIRCLRPSP